MNSNTYEIRETNVFLAQNVKIRYALTFSKAVDVIMEIHLNWDLLFLCILCIMYRSIIKLNSHDSTIHYV